jgi:ubiquinone/menaquinone biosynthesis C-methylase UbiE
MSEFDQVARDWDAKTERAVRAGAVAEAIRRNVPLDARTKALEYGCGTGLLGFCLQADVGALTLADSSEGMLEVLREKISAANAPNMTAIRLDLIADPLPDDLYDLVFSLMTLHHIRETGQILRQFRAMLSPGGHLCVADLDVEDGSFHGQGFDGHNGFDRDALAETAHLAGFDDIRFETVFSVRKETETGERDFPVFLMTARA